MKIFVARQSLCSWILPVILSVLFHGTPCPGQGQPSPSRQQDSTRFVIIRTIHIDGNKITHPSIITRELCFKEKDTIPMAALSGIISSSRDNVFNTALFNFVTIDTSHVGTSHVMSPQYIDIRIHLIERWYIWPWPYFVISDRNFNAWLETTDFSKITYGINLTFFNMRGRNETLVFPIHFGFNQRLGFAYKIPYINHKKTIGIGFGANYDRNHEVVMQSLDNKPVYFRDTRNFPMQNANIFFELYLRPDFYSRHTFHLDFNQMYLTDTMIRIPGYSFDNTTNRFNFFSFYYQFRVDHRDIQFYPLKGYYFDATFIQNGLYDKDINQTSLKATFRKYWKLYNRWYFASGIQGKFSYPETQPYFLQRGLGYGRDFVRGYEYYIIDGQSFLLLKNNIKFALVPPKVAVADFLKSIKFNTIPYALYVNVLADFGYVYNGIASQNEDNDLQNRLLIGYGIGLDFTTYYDVVIRLEASINREGIPGLYLHFIAPI